MEPEPAAAGAARQRRLPTKTRSGIITLPTASQQAAAEQQLCGLVKALATAGAQGVGASGAQRTACLEDDDDDLLLAQSAAATQRQQLPPTRRGDPLGDTTPAGASPPSQQGGLARGAAATGLVLHPPQPPAAPLALAPEASQQQQQQRQEPASVQQPAASEAPAQPPLELPHGYEQHSPNDSSPGQQCSSSGASSSTAQGGGLHHLPRPGPGAAGAAAREEESGRGGASKVPLHDNPSGAQQAAPGSPASPPAIAKKPSPPPPQSKGGGRSLTGPLNSSTSPTVVSLPVKRRGSYQSLKRANATEDGAGSSVLKIVNKKATHWERFGTILVLYCATDKTAERDGGVLQMMMAEGYDTHVVDCQADALQAFNAGEVFPDMVLIDADHSYNTLQLMKQLQGHNATVAIIVMGSAGTRPGCITALQAGAADYLRKPVDVDELLARVERHVQRQHCIKLELDVALEKVKAMVAQLSPAASGKIEVPQAAPAAAAAAATRGALIAVAETDFEEQMGELSEENARLASRLSEARRQLKACERDGRALEQRLAELEPERSSWYAGGWRQRQGVCRRLTEQDASMDGEED